MESEFHMGNAVKIACVKKGISQGLLAEKIGVSPSNMSHIVKSKHMNTKKLCSICNALDIQPIDLIGYAGFLTK